MGNSEKVVLLYSADEMHENVEVVAIFTGPDAQERAQEVQRLKSMKDDDLSYYLDTKLANPTNQQLELGAPLHEVETLPFVQAAIASIFTHGSAIVPSWLSVEWLRYEVSKHTNEDIMADGQRLKLNPPQRWGMGIDQDKGFDAEDAGFVESDR